MNSNIRKHLGLASLLISALSAVAASGGSFNIAEAGVTGGGVTIATGGGFSMTGSIGQPEAPLQMGGSFSMAGGFWPDVVLVQLPQSPMLQIRRAVTGRA